MSETSKKSSTSISRRFAISSWILVFVQFLPLSFFATYAFWHGEPTDDRWMEAFQWGSLAALIQLLIVLPQRRPTNRLILAANLYLLAGGGAVFTHQWWLLQTYGVLREAGIFIAILIVGVVTTFASPAGFIATLGTQSEVRRASLWLLVAAMLGLGASLMFAGDTTWAAVVPIICLAIFHRVLQVRARVRCNETHN